MLDKKNNFDLQAKPDSWNCRFFFLPGYLVLWIFSPRCIKFHYPVFQQCNTFSQHFNIRSIFINLYFPELAYFLGVGSVCCRMHSFWNKMYWSVGFLFCVKRTCAHTYTHQKSTRIWIIKGQRGFSLLGQIHRFIHKQTPKQFAMLLLQTFFWSTNWLHKQCNCMAPHSHSWIWNELTSNKQIWRMKKITLAQIHAHLFNKLFNAARVEVKRILCQKICHKHWNAKFSLV